MPLPAECSDLLDLYNAGFEVADHSITHTSVGVGMCVAGGGGMCCCGGDWGGGQEADWGARVHLESRALPAAAAATSSGFRAPVQALDARQADAKLVHVKALEHGVLDRWRLWVLRWACAACAAPAA